MTRNSDTPSAKSAPWKVTYMGGFWDSRGRGGKEIPLNVPFRWGEERWIVPAVYACAQGLVLDLCKEADPEALKAFIEKWELYREERQYTKAEMREIDREHPLHAEFRPHITLNGKPLRWEHGCGVSWIPPSCLPEGMETETEAKGALAHYGLDPCKGWSIRRWTFQWATKNKPRAIRALILRMERDGEEFPSAPFAAPAAGESVMITHPLTGVAHTLTVADCAAESIEQGHLPDTETMEYPRRFVTMRYSLTPDVYRRNFSLQDCDEGDSPRRRQVESGAFLPTAASSIGIIGGASGPTAIFITGKPAEQLYVACSSLHFEPLSEPVTWEPVFREKLLEDVEVDLIPKRSETV